MKSKSTILLLEKDGRNHSLFDCALRESGFQVELHKTPSSALACINGDHHQLVVLNAASMNTSGVRIAKRFRSRLNGTPIILIQPSNLDSPVNGYADEVLVLPFTSRKLVNRVARYLPPQTSYVLTAGPIHLEPTNRLVRAHGKTHHLPPKAIEMLRILMDRQGRVVTRVRLMKKVWKTDYTGDMRTIDVHASWIRKVIEADPAHPKLLKTIRGMGYRLDIP
jgi:DNA-binding response OmpR family regulator